MSTKMLPEIISHQCPRYGGVTYVSEQPRVTEDGLVIPGCGCFWCDCADYQFGHRPAHWPAEHKEEHG